MESNEIITRVLKCDNCDKLFRDDNDFQRHKNRKTPCLANELKLEDKNKPHCIYCNRIFTKVSSLNRHFNRCPIKNGGVEILTRKIEKRLEEIEQNHAEEIKEIKELKNQLLRLK